MTAIAANLEARTNMIRLMIANIKISKARNAIKRQIFENIGQMTRQTHHQAILIRPTTVPIYERDTQKRIAIIKRILSNYTHG